MRKGQANLIEYVLTILFSSMIIISIVTVISTFSSNAIRSEATEGMKQVAIIISNEVVKAYNIAKNSNNQPNNSTSTLLYEVDLKLPNQISKRSYQAILVTENPVWSSIKSITINNKSVNIVTSSPGAKVIIKTTQDPFLTFEYDIPNVDVTVQGKCDSGINSTLRYYRYNLNGTIYDTVLLGNYGILTRINSIG